MGTGSGYECDRRRECSKSQSNAAVTQTLLTAPLKAYGAYQSFGGTWNPFTQSKAAPISAAVGTPTGR